MYKICIKKAVNSFEILQEKAVMGLNVSESGGLC